MMFFMQTSLTLTTIAYKLMYLLALSITYSYGNNHCYEGGPLFFEKIMDFEDSPIWVFLIY